MIPSETTCLLQRHFWSNAEPASIHWNSSSTYNQKPPTKHESAIALAVERDLAAHHALLTWLSVQGTASPQLALTPTPASTACLADGENSICAAPPEFNLPPGVLSFTRVIVAVKPGVQLGQHPSAIEAGQMLDTDIFINSNLPALPRAGRPQTSEPSADSLLQELLTHEFGHFLGLTHSSIRGSLMYSFTSRRDPSAESHLADPDPLRLPRESDRHALRALFPNPAQSQFSAALQVRILPINISAQLGARPTSASSAGATLLAIDEATHEVFAESSSSLICGESSPFHGIFQLTDLPRGHTYRLISEPATKASAPVELATEQIIVCHDSTSRTAGSISEECSTEGRELFLAQKDPARK